MHNGLAHRGPVVRDEPFHHWIPPLFGAFFEGDAAHDRSNQDGKHDKCEGDRPGHRLEQASLDGLQCKDGQIRSNDNAAGKEDRPLYFVRGIANLLCRTPRVIFEGKVADDVFYHHHGAVYHHSEIQRTQR